MTPFEQDQLLDQVRANGNWVEEVENGLTLDGHFQLADLRKLVTVLEARFHPLSGVTSLTIDVKPEDMDSIRKLLELSMPVRPISELHLPQFERDVPAVNQTVLIVDITTEEACEIGNAWGEGRLGFNRACRKVLSKAHAKVPDDAEFYLYRQVDPENPKHGKVRYFIEVLSNQNPIVNGPVKPDETQ